MKTYNTVSTEERAKEIINAFIEKNNLEEGSFSNWECKCECGETSLVLWKNDHASAEVAVCDCCGDNDAFESDVLVSKIEEKPVLRTVYQVAQVFELEVNTEEFETEEEARERYSEILSEDGYEPTEQSKWEVELRKAVYEDDYLEEEELLDSEIIFEHAEDYFIYIEDMKHYKPYKAYWSAEKQETIYKHY